MVISDEGHYLAGEVEYSCDLFEFGTIDRLMNHYGNALKGIVEDSERPISDLSLLSVEERERQIVVEWNETGKSFRRICGFTRYSRNRRSGARSGLR